MGVNREYKDSVFSMLFNDKERLLELYNAIYGTNYTDKNDITMNTLQNVLFMGRKNDKSFLFHGVEVVVVEHQSSVNDNMALRMLPYITRIYERMLTGKDIYSRKRVMVPWPVFIVLYNGVEDLPAESAIFLSGNFLKPEGYKGKAALELEVKVYNVNKGMNPGIEGRSPTLAGYAELVDRARKNEKAGMGRNEAVSEAVRYCMANGILVNFLKEHGSEVESMLTAEWDMVEALKVSKEEGIEEGLEKGLEKGREETHEKDMRYFSELIGQAKTLDDLKRMLATSLPRQHGGVGIA
jgi:hypothetical protein